MGALDGILVVAIEQAVAAPLCTLRLVEAGARVIKVERAAGDFARGYDEAAKGESSYFAWLNKGKESLIANIKEPSDLALIHNILESADVLVQNLAPGATERAGLGSEAMRALNPKLITCDISGYGDSQETSDLKAYDLLVQGESGLISVSGPPGPFGRVGVSICDIGAGISAYGAIMEAIVKRARTGRGSGVAVSLFDVAAEWMTVPYIHQLYGEGAPPRIGVKHPSIAPYGAFTSKDGDPIIISIQNEREWNNFCEHVLIDPDFATNDAYASNNRRVANRLDLDHDIQSKLSTLDMRELIRRLSTASIAFGRINSVEGLTRHSALRRQSVQTAAGGMLEIPAPPARSSSATNDVVLSPPLLGEHTERIQKEFSKH